MHFDGVFDNRGAIFFVEPSELHFAIIDVFEAIESLEEHLKLTISGEFLVAERRDQEKRAMFRDDGKRQFPEQIQAVGIGPMDVFDR